MSNTLTGVPVIDPTVRYVGVSKLRELKADKLRSLHETLVIQDDKRPLAIMLSYDQFLEMQNERDLILATLETYASKEGKTREEIIRSIHEADSGQTLPFRVNKTLRERKAIKGPR